MNTLRPYIKKLIESLPTPPAGQDPLKELVVKTLEEAKPHASSENWKAQWEVLLRDEMLKVLMKEGKALREDSEAYYEELRDRLDIVLLFAEHDACDQTFPFHILQDVLESQTIETCSQVFSWIEDRASRLTRDQAKPGLTMLRSLNDLIRRLSKTGSTTILTGRILTFMSLAFPLGERSGVNLRGEYGPQWEGVTYSSGNKEGSSPEEKGEEDVDMKGADSNGSEEDKDTMDVDTKPVVHEKTEAEKKEEFYNTFWSLQLYFSNPRTFVTPGSLEEFKQSVGKVIPVIKEATAKERAMMGSRNNTGTAASLKRKLEPDIEEANINDYFFSKFLTSPELLDLEIADTHFRRQFLMQMLILLQHLLSWTPEAKAEWQMPRNKSLHMDFTLEPADEQWVHESIQKVTEELKQTTPNGRQFAETVSTILEREKNWVKWKAAMCEPAFDKQPWSEEVDGKIEGDMWKATSAKRLKMQEPAEPWKWALGTKSLTEVWAFGYRNPDDLEAKGKQFDPPEPKAALEQIKKIDGWIAKQRGKLETQAAKMAQARARALAASQPLEKTEARSETVEPAPSTAAAPSPKPLSASGSASAPLHPSLPPKPGSPVKAQEPIKASASGAPLIVEAPSATPAPPAVAEEKPPLTDQDILAWEQSQQREAWLGLRAARDKHLQHFGRIGNGDLEALVNAIAEAEEKGALKEEAKEEAAAGSDEPAGVESNPDVKMDG
ncbi:hypothetical protein D9611_005535 [Ephemerocybe angulata]|uniref:Uncharacterized protein n=1 Tax=Ephemerocybe angulata TaxID=980116 RepID=A0A8H5BH61_9AGAR|nr:hypothetical protein D9611_005535 [Tulosesus angulatus]